MWDCCCPWVRKAGADPINSSVFSFFHSLSLPSGGEAWRSLDDPQTDPRHQHESTWATGESLHRECLFLPCAASAGFPDAQGSKEAYILPPLGQVLTLSPGRITSDSWRFWKLFCVFQAYLMRELHSWESLLVNMFLELIIDLILWLWFDLYYSLNIPSILYDTKKIK